MGGLEGVKLQAVNTAANIICLEKLYGLRALLMLHGDADCRAKTLFPLVAILVIYPHFFAPA